MNKRERFLLIGAIVLLGAVCFKFLIYDPQQAARASLVEARDAAAAELVRNERILAKADKVRAEYDRLRAFIATFEAKMPTTKEIPALLTKMEQFTKRLGITLDSVRPGPLESVTSTGAPATPASGTATPAGTAGGSAPTAGKSVPYSRMQVSLSITGTFAQVVQYLKELREFPRLVVVDSISLSPQTLPLLSTTLTTQIYTLGSGSASGGK